MSADPHVLRAAVANMVGVEAQIDSHHAFVNPVVNYQTMEARHTHIIETDTPKVLVLYVGGTIGMVMTDNGYVPIANHLEAVLLQSPQFHDSRMTEKLILPRSIYGKRVHYVIKEWDPLLDSSDMNMSHWLGIAKDIQAQYDEYDAFIVLHGTDTMVYTCAALSFMLENLSKTVIVTGSQIPLSEVRNDAQSNLFDALTIAGHFRIPEVCLYFNAQLLRGNRAKKVDNLSFNAFSSPNFPPLALVGINIDIDWQRVLPLPRNTCLEVNASLCFDVAIIYVYPGMTSTQLKALMRPPIRGIVLGTFGAGNIPQGDLFDILKETIAELNLIVVNCTQCLRGIVSDIYASGRALSAIGIIPGYDMTIECAFAKLSCLIGQSLSTEEIKCRLQTDLRGELTTLSLKKPT